MKTKKGAGPQLQALLFAAFMILLLIIVFYVITTSAASGEAARKAIEKASLVYFITSSVNSLSTTDMGVIEKDLYEDYEIEIDCSDEEKCEIILKEKDRSIIKKIKDLFKKDVYFLGKIDTGDDNKLVLHANEKICIIKKSGKQEVEVTSIC